MPSIRDRAREVYAHRELLLALTYRDIRVRYKQAIMGVLWVFFMPLLAVLSGVIFRVAMAYFRNQTPQVADLVAVMVKSVPWILFAGIVSGSAFSLLGNMGLLTKIYFPREIVPLSSMLSTLFDFAITFAGMVLVIVCMPNSPVRYTWYLLLVPVILLLLLTLAFSVGLVLAVANVFFRDVKYVVQVLLQFGIFFSLVYFTHHELKDWSWVFLLNPVSPLMEALRCIALNGAVDAVLWPWLGYSVMWALGGFVVAVIVFERAEELLAEFA